MTKLFYTQLLTNISIEESKLSLGSDLVIKDVFHMITYLKKTLDDLKKHILLCNFQTENEEIEFFKKIKPQILGKLIFYNKVYRIEINSPPITESSNNNYYSKKIIELDSEYKKFLNKSDFYRYFKSGRTDKDKEYFTRENINIHSGVNSYIFEIDTKFSTYYDYKIAKIYASKLLNNYLNTKLIPPKDSYVHLQSNNIAWTDSHASLIELIYALYASGSINQGNLELRKIAHFFQSYFNISLKDIHHSFHRMKTRSNSRTLFLDKLKQQLETYMDKEM